MRFAAFAATPLWMIALGLTGGSLGLGRQVGEPRRAQALIQTRGASLRAGRVRGGGEVILERAQGGDTGAEGVFLTESLAERLTPLRPSQPARLAGVCGLQDARRQRLMGLSIGAEASPPLESVEVIILTNPVFPLLGVEAIVGQELLRDRRQLWRLDASPPRLEIW